MSGTCVAVQSTLNITKNHFPMIKLTSVQLMALLTPHTALPAIQMPCMCCHRDHLTTWPYWYHYTHTYTCIVWEQLIQFISSRWGRMNSCYTGIL